MVMFNSTGAAGGAVSGGVAGARFGPYGALIGGAVGGLAGGFLPGSQTPNIDISKQLAQVQSNAMTNRGISNNLYSGLAPITNAFQTGSNAVISGAANNATAAGNAYQANVGNLTTQTQDALRKNLYSSTFNGLPATLEATREASAAGGGIQSGSYGNAVKQVGVGTAQTLAQGEAGIQAQGLQARTQAAGTAYQTVQGLMSKLSSDQLNTLSTVMSSGRADLIQNAATQMGLNDQETQSLIDLYNFQQSGGAAAATGQNANNQSLLNSIINAGATYGAGSPQAMSGGK